MTDPIEIKVKRGTKFNIIEVDDIEEGYDAAVNTTDDRRLKVHVKRLSDNPGVSSRVVDVLMCG